MDPQGSKTYFSSSNKLERFRCQAFSAKSAICELGQLRYSQHFIFFVTYKLFQLARVLQYSSL